MWEYSTPMPAFSCLKAAGYAHVLEVKVSYVFTYVSKKTNLQDGSSTQINILQALL